VKLKDGPAGNFEDRTGGSKGFQAIKDKIGLYLYHNGFTQGADKKYFNPEQAEAYDRMRNTPMPKLDAQGRRADIDWGSNAGMSPLMSAAPSPEALAKRAGFKNAAQALAWKRKQIEMNSNSGPAGRASAASPGSSLLDQMFAIHPSVMLKGVLDKMNKAIP
jgi:hypothetical protein